MNLGEIEKAARGGVWITKDGEVIPVLTEYEHGTTAARHGLGNETYLAKMNGHIHVGLYYSVAEDRVPYELNVAFYADKVTVAGLRSLVSILRHYRAKVPYLFVAHDGGQHWSGREEPEKDRVINGVSKFMLDLNAKQKAAREAA